MDIEASNNNNNHVPEVEPEPPRIAQTTKAAIQDNKKDYFPFLKLPGELRERIYHYAVVYHETVCIQGDHRNGFKQDFLHKVDAIASPLARVCKQINTEVGPLIYSKNTFYFHSDHQMRSFLIQFAPHSNLIRRIVVDGIKFWLLDLCLDFRVDELIYNLNSLIPLENLESLQMTMMFESTLEGAASTIFLGSRAWFEAVGERRGDKHAALDIIKGSSVTLTSTDSDGASDMEQDVVVDFEVLKQELMKLF